MISSFIHRFGELDVKNRYTDQQIIKDIIEHEAAARADDACHQVSFAARQADPEHFQWEP